MTESSNQSKGRPTPKRSDAQKRRSGPVTPPPTNRREAAKQLRAKQAVSRERIRIGTRDGDESAMLPRDAGPARRAVRDVVDSRHTLGFLLIPTAVLVFVGSFINAQTAALAFEIEIIALVVVGTDLFLMHRKIKAMLLDRFPNEKPRPLVLYGIVRATQFTRLRRPLPKVSPPPRSKRKAPKP